MNAILRIALAGAVVGGIVHALRRARGEDGRLGTWASIDDIPVVNPVRTEQNFDAAVEEPSGQADPSVDELDDRVAPRAPL